MRHTYPRALVTIAGGERHSFSQALRPRTRGFALLRCGKLFFFGTLFRGEQAVHEQRAMLSLVNDRRQLCCLHFNGEIAMKTITSALIALSVLAGIAAPASAFDARSFYAQTDRESR